MNPSPLPSPKTPDSADSKLLQAGTLTYTKAGMGMLFLWLFWGDFCFQVMEQVAPSLIPVKFIQLHASNLEIGILLGTIPTGLYTILNPIISFKSDRYRSRWGRRIPFILFTLPCLVLSLVALAFGPNIAFWLHSRLGSMVGALSPDQMAICTIGLLMAVFTFFNTFITSVFWYLFNDVVPERLLARFMSWFRMVSLGSVAFYSFYVFPYAESHYVTILLGAAALYFVGFGLMCFNVKEGEYPPPPPYIDGKTGPVAAVVTCARECHTSPHYWYLWIGNLLGGLSGGALGTSTITAFGLLFYMSCGMSNKEIGGIYGSLTLVSGGLILVSGWLADIYHPIRVYLAGVVTGIFLYLPANMIWLIWHPTSHNTVYWIVWATTVGLGAPAMALTGVSDPPLLMRLFPRERYGQFCSVNAIWRSIGGMLGGGFAGWFLDFMVKHVGKETAYFYVPVWQFVFSLPGMILGFMLYFSWKRHGGDEAYVAPVLEAGKNTLLQPVSL